MAFCLSLAFFIPAWAGDGALDPSFNPGAGVTKIPILRGQSDWINNTVTPNVPTGVSLIYGYFNQIADSSHTYSFNSLAKINDTNGTIDPNFHFPINGPDGTGVGDVRFAYLSDPITSTCDIIIGGSFSVVASDSSTYYNLARLTYNSSTSTWAVDTTFPHIFKQGGLVWSFALTGTYKSNGYILAGGYDLKPTQAVQGDPTKAYQLIRLSVSSGDYIYDPSYTARNTPGTVVSSIKYRPTDSQYPGAVFIFGTFPQTDGSVHWVEVLSSNDLSTVVASLGSNQFDGPIYNMIVSSYSPFPRIFVGSFKNATFEGITTSLNRIAQVSANLSSLDNSNSFNANINSLGGANHAVQQIIFYGDQPVLAGNFTKFNGIPCGHITRLNYSWTAGYGTVDTSFNYTSGNPNAGADDRIFKLYKPTNQPTLQILGSFQTYNGSANPRHCIANLNGANGAINSAYSGVNPTTTGLAAIGTVYAISEIWGNEGYNWWNYIVIGGDFTGVNGKFNMNLAFLNKDGTLPDHNGGSTEGPVKCIRNLGDGSALIAGNFGYSLGVGCTGLLHLTSNGNVDYTVRPVITKADGTVADLHSVDMDESVSDKLSIMGKFAYVYDSSGTRQSRTAFALLNSDGSLNTYTPSFNIPNSSNIHVNVGGPIGGGSYGMVGYYQKTTDSSDCGFACVLDGSGNQTHLLTFNGEVTCAYGSDNRIVLGGKFTQVTYPVQANRNFLAALTSSFTLDSSFTGATDGPVYALQPQGENDDGNILIGGNFTHCNGVARNNLARLLRNGDLDNSFIPGNGPNGRVNVIRWTQWGTNGPTVGKAIVGGAFTSYDGTPMRGIAQIFASQPSIKQGVLYLLLGD